MCRDDLSSPASAIVLAGGLSCRLGLDKRRLRLWGPDGPTLLEHTVATVAALCADVVVVLNDAERWPNLSARIVGDRYAEGGALGGIASGLAAAREPYALVVACDMPLLSRALLGAMLALSRNYDVLIPRAPSPGAARNPLGVEPLHAIYASTCLGPIVTALAAGRRQITSFFPAVRVSYLDPALIRRHDPHCHSFININTLAQLADAEHLLAGRPSNLV
jgi:molybdenum cofactor guanylyltransferase